MNIINDSSSVDYLTYFTKQMPKDLAAMAVLRDELAVRQGALSAAEDTVKLKAQAAAALESATAEAAAILADAKEQNAAAKAKKSAQDTREKQLDVRENEFLAKSDARDKDLTLRETQMQKQIDALDAKDAKLFAASAKLDEDRTALEARIKAFQDKVASINV